MLAVLEHPNIVEVLDAGASGDADFLVMPLLIGEDLAALLQRERRLSWTTASALVLQLCDALAHIHARGVVHGDVQPANCIVQRQVDQPPRLTLIDLGSAVVRGRGPVDLPRGTPAYRSLEQFLGTADARSDVYGVAAVLFHMLTGCLPLPRSPGGPIPRMSQVAPDRRFAPELERIVACALHPRPDERPRDILPLAAAIRACQGRSVRTRSRPMTALLLAFTAPMLLFWITILAFSSP